MDPANTAQLEQHIVAAKPHVAAPKRVPFAAAEDNLDVDKVLVRLSTPVSGPGDTNDPTDCMAILRSFQVNKKNVFGAPHLFTCCKMQEMQRQISSVSGMCLPVDVCNSAGDWYQGFILEEQVDRVMVHLNGWEHKWNESIPNTKVRIRIRPRNISTKIGPLGAESPDRVIEDWQRLRLKDMIERGNDHQSRSPTRGRHWNAARGMWIQDAEYENSARSELGCFAAEVAGINLRKSPWCQSNILGCDGDGSFTAFGLKTSESGSLAGVWHPGDIIDVAIDRYIYFKYQISFS
jgi:hypothetical protein